MRFLTFHIFAVHLPIGNIFHYFLHQQEVRANLTYGDCNINLMGFMPTPLCPNKKKEEKKSLAGNLPPGLYNRDIDENLTWPSLLKM